jgi:hypothetical protein
MALFDQLAGRNESESMLQPVLRSPSSKIINSRTGLMQKKIQSRNIAESINVAWPAADTLTLCGGQ